MVNNSLQQDWPQDVLDSIEYRQEVAYRSAADLLDLAGPEEAFALLCEKPTVGLSPEEFRTYISWDPLLSGGDWEQTKRKIEAAERDPSLPSTRWEDVQVRQKWIRLQQDLSDEFLETFGSTLDVAPSFAALPTRRHHPHKAQTIIWDHLILFLLSLPL